MSLLQRPSHPQQSQGSALLSDLLNLPTVTTPVATKTGKAHVLTSSECLRSLKEKEDKKREIAEEKERQKQERELKKQQKE